jgi:hypothetical protein
MQMTRWASAMRSTTEVCKLINGSIVEMMKGK